MSKDTQIFEEIMIMIKNMRSIVALNFFAFALSAVRFADTVVQAGAGGPSNAVQASRTVKAPVLDTSKMSKKELEAKVQELLSNQTRVETFKIRFNDGSDPAPKQANGDPGSKRDGGGFSVYGFGRLPITMFGNQLIDLSGRMPAILQAIAQQADHVDAYVFKKTGNHKNDINRAELSSQLAVYGITWPAVAEGDSDEQQTGTEV